MFRSAVLVLALAAMTYGRSPYIFSDGIETILSSPIKTSFECTGRAYGYYADTDNNCEVFHVCLPIEDDAGSIIETAHFSFACGNQTVFSQDSLTCSHPEAAFPCADARSLYDSVNAEFGKIDNEGANATDQAKERYGLGGLIPRDPVLELHNDTNASEVPAEICVPTNAQNFQFDEYDIHEGICCHTTPDTTCGIPNGALDDEHFGMQTFPWEAVLSVTMKPANSDKEDTTYCSGALISEEWLLTTAACILRPKNKHPTTTPQVNVSFVVDTTKHAPVNYGVKEYIVYPTASETHDITLVRLDRKNARTPVCLPPYNKGAINDGVYDQPGIVFGWVLPANSTPYMSTRNQQVISSAECIRRLGTALSPHILCTVDRVTEDEPCLADGHLLVGSDQFTLQGLSTPRLECKDNLRQHSSMEHFIPWISSITGIKMRN